MTRRLAALLLVLLAVPFTRAQDAPERLLSAQTHLYLRWDGVSTQQTAFEKTALAQIIQGDTGQLITTYLTELKATHLLSLLRSTSSQGLVIGVEVLAIDASNPPDWQLTAILPNSRTQWEPLFGSVTWAADQIGLDVKEMEVMKRTVYYLKGARPCVGFWKEGNDAVLVIASGEPDAAVKRALASTPRLNDSPLFKKVQEFKEFKTVGRGFLSVSALMQRVAKADPQAPAVLETLGLNGIKDITFQCGFDGPALRNLVLADIPGPRKGLAQLASAKPFKLDDLPALPADLTAFTALRADAGALFDGGVELVEKLLPPNEAPAVKAGIATANQAIGIDIRKDLIGALGTLVVSCSAPADGGLIFGQSLMIQVKDEKQFTKAMDQTLKGLSVISGGELRVKQRAYRGVMLNTVHVRERGFFLTPTYAVHKGWLVVAMTPQPVQGFVLRSAGELPAWKPNAEIQAALGKLPAQHSIVSVSDPRSTVKLMLSAAPLFGQGIMSEIRGTELDFPLLPNGDEFARHLFPNVSVASDDGKTWRMESRSSFDLPFGLLRADGAALGMMMMVFAAETIR
jgi:hypothetical protein